MRQEHNKTLAIATIGTRVVSACVADARAILSVAVRIVAWSSTFLAHPAATGQAHIPEDPPFDRDVLLPLRSQAYNQAASAADTF